MSLLKKDIEEGNNLVLTALPRFLTSKKRRAGKNMASVVIAFEGEPHEMQYIGAAIYAGNGKRRCVAFRLNKPTEQCQNYYKFGYNYSRCPNPKTCRICAEQHATAAHACQICPTVGNCCAHTIRKCTNCGSKHVATHLACKRRIFDKETPQSSPDADFQNPDPPQTQRKA